MSAGKFYGDNNNPTVLTFWVYFLVNRMKMIDIRRYFSPVIVRALIYACLLALITVGTMRLPGESFYEGRIVEWLQFTFLALSAAAFIHAASGKTEHKAISLVLAGGMAIAGIRECDRFLDHLICDNFWKVGVTLFFIGISILIYKDHDRILESVNKIIHWNAFGILLSGFLVLLFSRLFGHNDYWTDLIGKTNQKIVLQVIEENTELLSYFIFLAGSLEYSIKVKKLIGAQQENQGT